MGADWVIIVVVGKNLTDNKSGGRKMSASFIISKRKRKTEHQLLTLKESRTFPEEKTSFSSRAKGKELLLS